MIKTSTYLLKISYNTYQYLNQEIIITYLVDADENMCKRQNTDSECHSEKINVGSSYKRVVLRPLLEYL